MLLLARRIHEEIVVIDRQTGEQIVVTPTGYRGNQVTIGIEAPKDRFTILRREVLERPRDLPDPEAP
jgi:carbon storage regulator CsrA